MKIERSTIIDGELHLFCTGCQEYLPADPEFFYRNKNRKTGFRSRCKACYYETPSAIARDTAHIQRGQVIGGLFRESVITRVLARDTKKQGRN
ncbi:hypothetical protein [Stenoxybacter acetivorans]|uniref:hypothetical protein n=1 Tax=Stenoxybacter acetivorans TaxID=422441 RepID=UPI00056B10B3|nr:hypothetical protein [Stenoxybacter acetivorans]